MADIFEYRVSQDIMNCSDTCLAPLRRKLIKFYGRLDRVASRTGLSIDEVYTIWRHCVPTMTNRQFFNLFLNDETFRANQINRHLHG